MWGEWGVQVRGGEDEVRCGGSGECGGGEGRMR